MTTPSRQRLREWSTTLTLGPLDPADPKETRYVPLAEAGRGAVDELLATIELAIDTTTQLISGPSGSGKTTELRRLRGELESAGFHAAIFDVGTYVNESSPIDVTEFLIALALGAHDVLGAPEVDEGPGFVGRRAASWTASRSPSMFLACPPACPGTVWNSRRWARRSRSSCNAS